ncbi:MAG TPA: class I SAM-dependent methyltransferase [Anaerolineae bacterium]|nr:class I SAM-dependent methyltransferase [Anaerolineae bacterium]
MIDFNERARDWDSDPAKVERARLVAGAMHSQVTFTPQMSALEYGCGTGLLSFALQDSLGQICLADSSPGMLAVLAQKISLGGLDNMTARLLDLVIDPLPQERYDLIYSLMTLHHVADTDVILQRFHALLKQNGVVCIADLDQEDGSFHGADFEGHKGFNRQALQQALQKTGFQNIRFQTVTRVTRQVDGQPKDFPVFLCCADKVG